LSQRPWADTLIAALTSRSWAAPHGQVHDRTFSGLGPSSRPHAEHVCDVGANRSIRPNPALKGGALARILVAVAVEDGSVVGRPPKLRMEQRGQAPVVTGHERIRPCPSGGRDKASIGRRAVAALIGRWPAAAKSRPRRSRSRSRWSPGRARSAVRLG
jgi:hypothetical protein